MTYNWRNWRWKKNFPLKKQWSILRAIYSVVACFWLCSCLCPFLTYMKPSQQDWIRPFCGFFCCFPKLLLRGISVHGTDSEQAVPELLGDVGQVPRLGAYNATVINQAETNIQLFKVESIITIITAACKMIRVMTKMHNAAWKKINYF